MPSALGWLTRAVSSGVLVSCPFACAQTNVKSLPKSASTVTPPPKPVEKTEAPKPPSIQEVLQEQGYVGCETITGQRGKRVLFVCWKKQKPTLFKPSLYHYDKATANLIVGISNISTSKITLKFENVSSPLELTYPPFWVNKLREKGEVKPETDCSLQQEDNKSTYKLVCSTQEIQRGISV